MIKKLLHIGFSLGRSRTARSLYWVFSGNIMLIVLTFFTTILVANGLTKAENGIFLALLTLANLLSDLGEAGLGSSLSNFIPGLMLEPTPANANEAKKILATAFKLELVIATVLGGGVLLLSPFLAKWLFANTAPIHVAVTGVVTFILVLFGFSSFALSAFKKFQEVALMNMFYSLLRLGLLVGALLLFKLSIFVVLLMYLLAFTLGWGYSLVFLKTDFLFTKGSKAHVKKLVGFSSFLALQKIFISVSSRLDLLMLVPLANAVEAGVYGIASRFSLVYPVAIASLGQVFAPKFAEFARGRDAVAFFKKTGIVILLLLISEVLFFIFAQPMMRLLVPKYVDAIPVFQVLLLALTGFIMATPFTSFLIYTLKKPQITTIASAIQLIVIFVCNWVFIPQYGRYGPAIGIGIGNMIVFCIAFGATWYYLRHDI